MTTGIVGWGGASRVAYVDFSDFPIEKLLVPGGYDCACGRHHEAALRFLKIAPGAIFSLPEALSVLKCKKPFLIADANSFAAAGERVTGVLRGAGIAFSEYVFPPVSEKMEPDERAVGAVVMRYDPSCDCVLAVGTGVVNDISKLVAHTAGVPQIICGTAPSMDGFASDSSCMIVDRVKVSLYNACPAAVICDVDIMKNAPMRMLLAGLGDMLAKHIALCDWRIARIAVDEPYCENIAQLMRRSLKKIVENAEGLVLRDPAAVTAVAEGLVLSGIAMSYAKCSRPASGLEHYFSHMWEMMALARGEGSDLHGIQVGVGTCLTLKLYDRLRGRAAEPARAEAFLRGFREEDWEAQCRRIFGDAADEIIRMERETRKYNDPAKHAERIRRLTENWDEIQKIIREELPRTQDILTLAKKVGLPTEPSELHISAEDTRSAFYGARDIRDKYLLISMLWDLGLMDEFADYLAF